MLKSTNVDKKKKEKKLKKIKKKLIVFLIEIIN